MIEESLMAAAVTMTGLEFDALPFEQGRYLELLDGEVIQMARPTLERQKSASRIERALDDHLTHKGAVVARDVGIALSRIRDWNPMWESSFRRAQSRSIPQKYQSQGPPISQWK